MREELNNTIEHAQRAHSLSALVIDVNEQKERTNTAHSRIQKETSEDWIVIVSTHRSLLTQSTLIIHLYEKDLDHFNQNQSID